jgi:hypothetical protein
MQRLAEQADTLCVIRSMFTVHPNHEPALFVIHSGRVLPGRPSLGSWTIFGLGSDNQNLPAYVVLDDPLGLPINGTQNWQAGFLPPVYQGTRIRSWAAHLEPAPGVSAAIRVRRSKPRSPEPARQHPQANHPGQMELDARISSYELAARLQLSASDASDAQKEDDATRALYGVGEEPTDSYGRRCLMARRLVEQRRTLRATLHQQPDLGHAHQPRRRHARRERLHR